MLNKRLGLFFVIISFLFLTSGIAVFADVVKVAMGYIPNVQFAPYYVAKELEYFKEEGLDVVFDYGMSTDIMNLVSKGTIDFGISDGDQVIIARSKGLKVKAIYTMYVKNPVCIVSLKDRGILNLKDLKGKRVGVPGAYGSNFVGLKILLHSAGLKLNDINMVTIGYTQVESLISGRVDAATVFINNEVVLLREMGKELNIFKVYDVSPMVSAVIVTGEELINQKKGIVGGFVRAVKKATEYIYKHNGDVMGILIKYIPSLTDKNLKINNEVLMESMDLWVDNDVKLHGFGYTSLEDWKKSIEILREIGFLNIQVDPRECYTDYFLR